MRVDTPTSRLARRWRLALMLAAPALTVATPAQAAGGIFTNFQAPFTGASNFATGFSSCAAGPTGMLFVGQHVFINEYCTATVYEFSLSGGDTRHPLAKANLGFTIMLASSQDRHYGVGSDGVYRWDPDALKKGPLVARLDGTGRGLVADPHGTDLIATTNAGIFRVAGPESASPRVSLVVAGNFDGIAVTADGERFYAADLSRGHVVGFDRQWSKVLDVDLSAHGPDGIAVARGNARINGVDISDNIFANSNDGTIERIDVHGGNAVSVVASGGTRGDVSVVGPDGCLYATQIDRVVRLDPCFFQPTGSAGHQRSSLAAALPSFADLKFDFLSLATSGLIATFLGLLIAFPGELFNSTLQEHYEDIKRWFRFGRKPLAPTEGAGERPSRGRHRWRSMALVAIVGDAIYCLLDPRFGFDWASLATFLGVLVALACTVLGFAFVYGLVLRVTNRERGYLRAFPGALVVAAACVLISRMTGFLPGYCYGLVAAFVLVGAPPKQHQGRASAIAAVVLLIVSLSAWWLWTPINALAKAGDPGFLALVLDTTLASIFLFGIQTVVFGLIPIRFLEGEKVVAWSRWVWAGIFGISLFAFVHILLNPTSGYVGRPAYVSPATVALLFLGFGAFSVAFWGFFRLTEKKPTQVPSI